MKAVLAFLIATAFSVSAQEPTPTTPVPTDPVATQPAPTCPVCKCPGKSGEEHGKGKGKLKDKVKGPKAPKPSDDEPGE